jgi:hypothetical protein
LAAVDPEPGALGEPELHYGRWHRGPAHDVGAVALAAQDADGTAGLGDVGGLEVQRLLDAKASPVEDGQQLADLGAGEDLGGALAHRTGYLKRLPCRFSQANAEAAISAGARRWGRRAVDSRLAGVPLSARLVPQRPCRVPGVAVLVRKVGEPARHRPIHQPAGEDGRRGRDDRARVFVDAQIG